MQPANLGLIEVLCLRLPDGHILADFLYIFKEKAYDS